MATRFVDTNIFLRYLTRDDPLKAQRCFELFQSVKAGREDATTSESVIAEVVYVLSSPKHYDVSREQIRQLLVPMLTLRTMRLNNRRTYLRALDLFVDYAIDFEDALSIAHMERQGLTSILSYDRDFDQVPEIIREEP
ncbi:MAG: PIN domain-containing protein [Dehalococcoidia bacterium]